MISILKEKKTANFSWTDLVKPSKEELNEVVLKYDLHKSLVEDSLQPEHLPKYERIENTRFIILRAYSQHAPKDADTIQKITDKIAVFFGEDFVITIHRAEFDFIKTINEQYVNEGKCTSVYEFIYLIVQFALSTYDGPLRNLSIELDLYEPTIFLQRKSPSILQNLYYIRRKASVIGRVLNLSKVILEKLEGKLPPPELNNLRDSLIRLQTNSDQTVDNVSSLLNTYISLSSQRTNDVMRILTLFSVFFLPLTFISGIYGMNFEFMPELGWKLGYPMAISFMLLVVTLIYLWFKRKGWL